MKVKICCISNHEEAKIAIQCGANAIGLVGHMPSGPGVISDALIHSISKETPSHIETFLLTSETTSQGIINHHNLVKTSVIQIVDSLTKGTHEEIKKAIPDVKLVQVIHVIDQQSVKEAIEASKAVDALLLDSGNPNLDIKQLGGTGRTHNWQLSKDICNLVSVPVYLAGGINKHNVLDAIRTVNPYGIDLCSSVRSNGKLDKKKLEEFFDALNSQP